MQFEIKQNFRCSKTPDDLMEVVLDSWKSIVDKSETPWALCEDCYESIQIYKGEKYAKSSSCISEYIR